GTGNDFVLFDNREGVISNDASDFFAQLCHRRFGIGADGVILLNASEAYDFEMFYVNADGHPSSMCGNGGRCIVAFAAFLGIIKAETRFLAIDGPHEARIHGQNVLLKMGLPHGFRPLDNGDHWIDTGSPHYVQFHEDGEAQAFDAVGKGRAIRTSEPWRAEGTNVNFVWTKGPDQLYVRTYERGVEDETWSCGTGVSAVAEIYSRLHERSKTVVELETPGGTLKVHVEEGKAPWLEGPAVQVFKGKIPYSPPHG
ncbi:UNVERIFIED_CONTAM: hypothetical protein GTU68_057479, partial [Idotea baltica]|nr:hypothetical protein [Idotea baltica]